ncbi:hypothetical protein [Mycobacterium sp. 1245852.3]|uniref:hypothetical protein n=1 Tax=Mycobacterium sp. 1245852.3 TaxID=1856860 RepID=UPI0007FF36D8|nr:hypothetical protein [Mycobacterium sp. 1245852.3]OBJ97963.1 hypothetical protein A9W96_18915 [Mycobacterium sp. 1245852.3]
MQKIEKAPWKDAPDLPGYNDWQALVSTLDAATRARVDDDELRYHMVRGLVPEIIFAAGGVEREIQTLSEASQIAQAYADAYMPRPIPQPVTGPPTIGPHASHHAAYAVMNALTWVRAVQERVSRKDFGTPAGLLASLKDGPLKTAIQSHFANLTPALDDVRKFDNYVLHAGAIQGGSTPGFAVRPDGTTYFPFPDDPATTRIGTWEEFRYNDRRDALTYLEGVFAAVETFIDAMLDAFDAQP